MIEFIKQFFKTIKTKIDDIPLKKEVGSITSHLRAIDEIQNKIAKQAYIIAEKDGFKDTPINYWIKAEEQVKRENS